MDATREYRLERLFEEARSLPPPRRSSFVAHECGADAELRATLESLLARAEAAHDFVERVARPAVARAAAGLLDDAPDAADAADAADARTDALVGRRVAHFQVVAKLGGGGMGRVYEALDLRLDRRVALKVLPPHLSADDAAKRRFVHEARAASALDHPGICAVHDIGETDAGELFIAMAHYEGETLKRKIARGPLPVADALDYAIQIAEGLQRAHDAGIVHRDVKPANVMVTAQGRVKIVDFGLAKMAGTDLTREGALLGTLAYMSPEQTRGERVDARTDLWSLGAVLHELLSGERPFRCESDGTMIHAIRHDEPASLRALRAEVPSGLAVVVRRCLAKAPADRYQRADELIADLRTVQAGGTVRRPGWRGRAARRVGAAVLAALLLVAGGRAVVRPDPRLDSLAVLPVATVAGDGAQNGLAEGMADMLIAHLSQLSGLRRVVSRAAVVQYQGTRKSPRQIGRELGVDVLVEMSVRRAGERVGVDVRLVAADEGRVVWRRGFERPLRDVLTLQREVARAIAEELDVRLTPPEAARMTATAREVHPEALALYLESARMRGSALERMALLERAIARDSTFALAHARIAISYIMLTHDRSGAERAIDRALALDPGLSDAYDALGLLRMWIDHDWLAAEAAFRHAIELNPHNGVAHHELGQLLMRVGRCDEAVAEERRAVMQNPGVAHFQSGLGEVYLYCRRYDDAIREFAAVLDLSQDSAGTFVNMGDAYFHQRQYAKALATYERSRRPPPGWAYVPLGSEREARAQIDSLRAEWARTGKAGFTTWNLARLHATLGEPAQAIAWLERTHEAGGGLVVYLGVHPQFDSLRGEPRFRLLLRRVGLAD